MNNTIIELQENIKNNFDLNSIFLDNSDVIWIRHNNIEITIRNIGIDNFYIDGVENMFCGCTEAVMFILLKYFSEACKDKSFIK